MVSESMTKPRERNRLITRLNVNGLLSIVATSVCFIWDHLRQRRAGHHHGENVLFWIDQELDERRAGLVHGPLDGPFDLGRVLHLPGRDAISVGQLDEVRRPG